MKRQFAIFAATMMLITVVGLMSVPRVLADLVAYLPGSVEMLGTTFTLQAADPTLDTADLLQARHIMARRLDQLNLTGTYEIVVLPEQNQLQVTLPENENSARVINVITHIGEIAFIDGGPESPPIGDRVSLVAHPSDRSLDYQSLFTGQDIDQIIAPDTNTGELFYQVKLQQDAAAHFNVPGKNYVCLVLDEVVTNCSKMYHWSGSTLEILPNLGDDTGISLLDLGIFFNSGPLPAPFEVVN